MANVSVLFSIGVEGSEADLKDLEAVIDFFNDHGGEIEHFSDEAFIKQGAMITPDRMEKFRYIDRNSDGDIGVGCRMDDTYSEKPICLIFSTGQGNVDAVSAIVQDWLIEKNSDKGIPLQWAETCSKPIPDNFGGGAVWITKDSIDMVSSHMWVIEKEHEAKLKDDTPEIG
jgi:hypothetical protein